MFTSFLVSLEEKKSVQVQVAALLVAEDVCSPNRNNSFNSPREGANAVGGWPAIGQENPPLVALTWPGLTTPPSCSPQVQY